MSLSTKTFCQLVARRCAGLWREACRRRPRRPGGCVLLWSVGVSSVVLVAFGPELVDDAMERAYIRLLSSRFRVVREVALEELAGRRAERALPQLIDLFRGRGEMALQSAAALASYGEIAAPALARAAGDQDRRVRYWAVRTLGEIGPAAWRAEEALESALDDRVALVQQSALVAVARVQGTRAVKAITAFLSSRESDPLSQIIAIQVLEESGRPGTSVLSTLERVTRDDLRAARVRAFAARAVETLRRGGGA